MHFIKPKMSSLQLYTYSSSNVYIERYLLYLYYICLIPFKPIIQYDAVILEKNRFQQTLCILNYIGGLIWTPLEIISTYPRQSVFASPPIVFSLVSQLLQYGYILIFVHKFWRREDLIKRLLRRRYYYSHSKLTPGKSNLIPSILCQVMPAITVTLAVSTQWSMWQLEYFLPFIKPSDRTDLTDDMFLSILKTVLMVQGEIMYCGTWYFVLVLAITGYRITKQCVEDSRKAQRSSTKYNMGSLLQTVHHLKQYFKDLNHVGWESFITVYCAIIPWASFRLMNTLPGVGIAGGRSETIVRVGFYWIIFIYNSTLLCLAAEAKRAVEKIRDMIVSGIMENEICNWTAVHTSQMKCIVFCKYVKHELRDVCFQGGPFFNISYTFIGTTIGIVITFTLYQLQFGKSIEGFSTT